MDFMQRGGRPASTNNQSVAPNPSATDNKASKKNGKASGGMKLAFIALLFSCTILIVALVLSLFFGKPGEARFVKEDKTQAVFLQNGQVYFGKINDLNRQFVKLSDIYYLQVQQQVQPEQGEQQQAQDNNVSLVKLGCELHGPEDQMIINREQVVFWENLKDDGSVVEAINQYKEANPNGVNCDQQTQQNSGGAGGTTQTQAEEEQ